MQLKTLFYLPVEATAEQNFNVPEPTRVPQPPELINHRVPLEVRAPVKSFVSVAG